MAKYVEDIFRRATERATILRRAERVVGAMRPEDNVPHHANLAYFQDQASFGAREVFGPYLDFSEWH